MHLTTIVDWCSLGLILLIGIAVMQKIYTYHKQHPQPSRSFDAFYWNPLCFTIQNLWDALPDPWWLLYAMILVTNPWLIMHQALHAPWFTHTHFISIILLTSAILIMNTILYLGLAQLFDTKAQVNLQQKHLYAKTFSPLIVNQSFTLIVCGITFSTLFPLHVTIIRYLNLATLDLIILIIMIAISNINYVMTLYARKPPR